MPLKVDLSHGPISKKTVGRQHNAVSHGIFAAILMKGHAFGEGEADYLRLLDGLRASINPGTPLEDMLVEKLAFQYIRLGRLYRADTRIARRIFAGIKRGLAEEDPQVFRQYKLDHEIAIVRKELSPELLFRYEASIERTIERTLTQLERLQRMRLGLAVAPPVKVEIS